MLKQFFADHNVDNATYEALCNDVEYRTGLVQHLLDDQGEIRPNSGEFVLRGRRDSAEQRFRDSLARNGESAWASLFGEEDLEASLASYGEVLARYRSF